jgi:peptidoglycan/xylan/chitin deacetylase (PgdA/CDA1 family)
MRFDRWLTLRLVRPFCAGKAKNGSTRRLPILMYHSISCDPEKGVSPYYRVATYPDRFAQQMKWLNELGYSGVSLEEGLEKLNHAPGNDQPPVAITFDDGFRDFYTAAWPELQRYGFKATVYLPTASINQNRASFLGKECLTWDEVRKLRKENIRFGSHTVTHPKLHRMQFSQIEDELILSKKFLEQELGEEITSFAYPYAFPQEDGRFKQMMLILLRKLGFRNGVTTVVGRSEAHDDPLLLKRLPVNTCDDRELFEAKLSGAYDWVGLAQNAFRHLKSWTHLSPRPPENPSKDFTK